MEAAICFSYSLSSVLYCPLISLPFQVYKSSLLAEPSLLSLILKHELSVEHSTCYTLSLRIDKISTACFREEETLNTFMHLTLES